MDMDDAIAAGDNTLHGAIDYWQAECEKLRAELAACREHNASLASVLGRVESMLEAYYRCASVQGLLGDDIRNALAARKGEGER